MRSRIGWLLVFFVFTTLSSSALAQPTACPALVSQALITVGDACGGIGRNQACYGNLSLLATPRDPKVELPFAEPGDLVGLAEVESFKLSSMSEDRVEWGIAVMSLQANLPDTLTGQNATMVLFGDVEIEDRSDDVPPLPDVFVTGNDVNVRAAPSTSSEIVGRVGRNRARQVVGKLEDGSWLRVVLQNGTVGWVFTSVVDVEGQIATLPVMTVDDPAPSLDGRTYGPMQAFRLRTGIGATACSEAPSSGIMIQTPEGASEVLFEANKVTIHLTGTLTARTTADTMRVAVVEGRMDFTIGGQAGTVRTGRVVVFELDANGDATGVHTIQAYSDDDVRSLPVVLTERQIDVQTPEQIAEALAARTVNEGIWRITWTYTASEGCGNDALTLTLRPVIDEVSVRYQDDGTLKIGEEDTLEGGYWLIRNLDFTLEPDGIWRGSEVRPDGSYEQHYELEFDAESGSGTELDIRSGGTCIKTRSVELTFLRPF